MVKVKYNFPRRTNKAVNKAEWSITMKKSDTFRIDHVGMMLNLWKSDVNKKKVLWSAGKSMKKTKIKIRSITLLYLSIPSVDNQICSINETELLIRTCFFVLSESSTWTANAGFINPISLLETSGHGNLFQVHKLIEIKPPDLAYLLISFCSVYKFN